MTPLDIIVTQDMVTVALLTTPLLSYLKPYISLLPVAKPDAPTRNVVLTGMGILLNFLLLVGMLSAQNALDWRYWYVIVAAAFGQQGISHIAFYASKNSGGAGTPTVRRQREYKGLPPFGSVQLEPPDPPVADGTPSPVEPTA